MPPEPGRPLTTSGWLFRKKYAASAAPATISSFRPVALPADVLAATCATAS